MFIIKKKETITTLSESSEQEALLCQIASLFAFIFILVRLLG